MSLNNSTEKFSISFSAHNRRNAYRVIPYEDELRLSIAGQPVEIINISSTGIAFRTPKDCPLKNSEMPIEGTIEIYDSEATPLPVELSVVYKKDNLYRCEMNLPLRGFNSLCKFLVQHQVGEIRKMQK